MIDEVFAQSISADLGAGQLLWKGEPGKTRSGSITETQSVLRENIYLGQPVARLRIAFSIAVGLISALFIFSLIRYIKRRPEEPAAIEKEVRRASKKYGDVIVDIAGLPRIKPGETVISLGSLDELVKAAEGLLRPVLHKEEEGRHIYCVLDDRIRYQCVLGAGPEDEAALKP